MWDLQGACDGYGAVVSRVDLDTCSTPASKSASDPQPLLRMLISDVRVRLATSYNENQRRFSKMTQLV